ncbi:hypothetical protein K1T35_48595 (plasmid) [Pseudonocardia sp. DSM 110487]|uniref:hypothetical protein n=1 Tax=Pseudonocardia sp. DSM 110487 TaxID=2865833 RepID=UPI001C69B234|nr:hypothetical protein [Pseudonocardia sp. DSM 110487]QYN41208.1 hypothetical protein K1T35_48595 [Pseudonocardia sp. DSM 110487]
MIEVVEGIHDDDMITPPGAETYTDSNQHEYGHGRSDRRDDREDDREPQPWNP